MCMGKSEKCRVIGEEHGIKSMREGQTLFMRAVSPDSACSNDRQCLVGVPHFIHMHSERVEDADVDTFARLPFVA